ncbi:MAG: hypothetical protein KDJ38_09795 [Gammaproteobacteria bacterium]|nr:hypothetical protein [Gammaproteobacteria bacterium]
MEIGDVVSVNIVVMPKEAMKKSLRKGYFYFELNHDYGADTVGAEAAELELNEGIDTFKVKLKPASDGQVHSGRKKRGLRGIAYTAFWLPLARR